MRPYQIYYAKVIWHGCEDERPWLIVRDLGQGIFGCFPISGSCYGRSCFPIDSAHPDFAATGLKKSCFIHDDVIIKLRAESLKRYKGELTGELLAEFLSFSGL